MKTGTELPLPVEEGPPGSLPSGGMVMLSPRARPRRFCRGGDLAKALSSDATAAVGEAAAFAAARPPLRGCRDAAAPGAGPAGRLTSRSWSISSY